jgi:hypothetical protein
VGGEATVSEREKPNSENPRRQHDAARRKEWFGIMYIGPEILDVIAPGEKDREQLRATATQTLLPIFDSHYEARWPNSASVPYTSIYRAQFNGQGPMLNIEIATWPGERTTVNLTAESPAQLREKPGIQTVQNPD